VKETVLNVEVESPEQRGVLSVGRGVWYTTDFPTQLYKTRSIAFSEKGTATKEENQALAA